MRKLAKKAIAIGLASTLAVTAVAGTAWGYFTDQVEASGAKEVVFGYDYYTDESLEGNTKVVKIENTGPTEIMVRVFIFGAGMGDNNGRTIIDPGDGWMPMGGDEGFTYNLSLKPGETTTEIRIELAQGLDAEELGEFEVTVVGQASPTAYDENGKPYGYNWTSKNQG